jgi:fucose permease
MAIIGGAVLPRIAGLIADAAGLHTAFLLPMVAYAAISVFAMMAAKARVAGVGQGIGNATADSAGHRVAH